MHKNIAAKAAATAASLILALSANVSVAFANTAKHISIPEEALLRANEGDITEMMKIGTFYLTGVDHGKKDYPNAMFWYAKAADLGHKPAMTHLGYMYEKGLGVERDYKKAAELYKKASSGKDSHDLALFMLASLHDSGYGVEKSPQKAFELIEKAAKKNHLKSQYQLGLMYQMGYATEKDIKKALHFFMLSCKNGYGKGCNAVTRLYRQELKRTQKS